MKAIVRTLLDLGAEFVLSPERYLAETTDKGVPLGELVTLRTEQAPSGVVIDTTHAKDGLLDVASALRVPSGAKSTKRAAKVGDVIVSRLRPYLRQIAYVHPAALAEAKRPLALSTEFYVLAPKDDGASIAFLVPYLLGDRAQQILAAAQEGGHHPRVPRESLFALKVPHDLVAARAESSKAVARALDDVYRAGARWQSLL